MPGRRDPSADDSPRLLVLVASSQDRTLLADRLGDEFDVNVASPDDDWGPFDCCLVDDRTLPTVVDALTARRAAADSVFLPVVLLAHDQRRADAALTGPMADTIDDALVLPTSSRLLGARVSSLVRRRRLSLRLDDERGRYRALAESARDAIVVFDEGRRIRFANPAVESVFGFTPEACLGTPMAELLPEAAVATPGGHPIETVADGGTLTAQHADGHTFLAELSVAPFDRDGERRYTAIIRDVTERETRTAALVEERTLLEGIFDVTPDIMVTFDHDGTLDRWNDKLPALSGYTHEELSGLSSSELIREGDRPVTEAALRAALEERTTSRVDARLVTRGGDEIPFEVAFAPLVDDHGETRGAVAAGRDVTERKARERALERSRDLLEQTQAIAHVGGWEIDAATLRTSGTDETYRIHDLPVDAELAFEEILESYHPDDADRAREVLERTLTTGDPFDIELRRLTDDGVQWLRVKGGRVDGEDRTVVRGTVQDITERVERERELEAQRERLELALDASNAGVWEWDLATDELVWHESCERLFGLEPGEFDGTVAASDAFVHPEDLPEVRERMAAVRAHGGEFYTEFRIERADGAERWLASAGRAIEDDHGEPARLVGVNVDITDRIEHKLELERSERRFRAVFEGANAAMVIANDDGEYVEVNPAATELFGLPEAELCGRTIADFAPPDYDFDGEWERFRNGETVTGEFPLVRPDGTRLSTRFSATPNILPGQHLAVLRDVTDRKRRERTLERYETIVQAAVDPIYALDDDGRITLANDALAAAVGRSVDDLLGTTLADLLDDAGVGASREYLAALETGGTPESLALTLSTPEGLRQYEVNVAPHGDDEADPHGTVGVARDVTDVVSRERRLSVLDRVLRHNIRNKLNVVLGHVETLAGDDSATVRASADAIAAASEELLDLSETARRFETTIRPATTVRQSMDLATHLSHVVEEVSATHPAATVSLDLDHLPAVEAHEALELAVEEVVENAVIHCDREPTVTVTARDCPGEGVVELRVADNGPGIAAVDRAALDKGQETPLEHMSGLGLWFVRWTVESSGGSLAVEDNDPRGTVVVLRLPRAAGH